MKKVLLLTMCSIVAYAMDYEEQPHPEHQLQLIVRNKNTTSEEFKTYLEARPKLTEVTVTGHQMTCIPPLSIQLDGLHTLDLSDGTLACSKTLPFILSMAPSLKSCKLAKNQIPALWSQEASGALPVHYTLTELDCSSNQITDVDFTELRVKLPNLTSLNLSNCPIQKFNTKKLEVNLFSNVYTTIDLRNTQLSDTEKKEILKNASVPCVLRDCDGKGDGIALILVAPVASLVCMLIPMAMVLATGIDSSAITVPILSGVGGGLTLGFGTTYLGYLGFKTRQNRFKILYKPLLDNANYPEEEITTRYDRFVKYFPYFCALSKCCKAEDPEYTPLSQA